MSKLTELKKQIADLEAQAERIAKEEMASALAKVKDIMAEFNLTIEHLTQAEVRKRSAKRPKTKTASVAKYADPKTGKTWSGFGRAPGWIAGVKNREAFLVGKSAAPEAVANAPTAPKKTVAEATKAVKFAKAARRPAAIPAKKSSKAKPAAKRVAAKKAAPRVTPSKEVAAASVDANVAPAA